ncbi:N-acetylmuramoyl-L-alanine amidase family protein [Paenibacillus sp. GCM10027627]|uniref:peptidoglycan recognition protein family protein n=1 Tax=unclassified Paenibacillus TaxID=185978 RepID=UPI00363BF176
MYDYVVDHIPKSTPDNRRPGISLKATTITIHNTANPTSTARNERNWLTNPSNTVTASFHIVIDEHEAIECIPLNEVAWHAGDGSGKDSGNRTSIGIEITESGNYDQTLENAASLVAAMLVERDWGTDRLRRHYDWSGKNCPRLMNEDGKWGGWTAFVNRVEELINDDDGEEEEPMLDAKDANAIILFLSAAYMSTNVPDARKEFNRLANELRKASGQEPQPG